MKPGTVSAPTALVGSGTAAVCYHHYSLSTEKTYLYWVKFFARRLGRFGVMQHPRGIGFGKVQAILSMLVAGGTARPLDALIA
jgi:hypothetical protein